ncbi:hypothetical protein A3D80_04015 [Candidatus Roizmanbacteria bacterium RIFCSPHIGHO2_02_FULL_40_13b]|uniref:Large ribosomal subunit protein bL25 n=1 Tax=Candidatus Roizmanbacteria bacterium RIFCSPHIGHO2_01_FULL_39_24 TaxID=1802032 RepID=A0A1F7GK22_9BACT|nr:MAG: hypothetical protein A2799_03570 [Candidatus Roizmanbacteria bacterium RIFCSPHIGHO2_01_FULL_39_24]OGK27958.1 MAG: hypothetical protein A3D80_04015 [Candidatus Roizmanbacteria bacterium RIFCSPHIGHO2_02_FULL_40_13b]OGK56359.1 MAG: hypothetical protein A3H83_02520 [Candidatus Roizmanbacteria bacterium RIFCSPLOWO2_02_FULL_39_8]
MPKTTKPEKFELAVEKRDIIGKKVKKLRREGKTPGNIYGEDFKSQAVSVETIPFTKVFKHAHETHVINLMYDGKNIPVLIQNTQKHPLTGMILHIDFRKVNLSKKIETAVPLQFTGESEAVAKKGGDLITQLNELTVEALPDALPDHIEIDLTKLVEIGDEIKVSDLVKSERFEIKDEPEKVIVRVNEHKEESVEPELESATPEQIGEEGETAEGEEAPAEGGEAPEAPADGAETPQTTPEENKEG